MEDSINDKMMTVMSKVHSVDFCHSVLLYVLGKANKDAMSIDML